MSKRLMALKPPGANGCFHWLFDADADLANPNTPNRGTFRPLASAAGGLLTIYPEVYGPAYKRLVAHKDVSIENLELYANNPEQYCERVEADDYINALSLVGLDRVGNPNSGKNN